MLKAAKAADLSWPTAKQLLLLRTASRNVSQQDLESARLNFLRLKPEMAKQGIALYKTRISQS